MSTNPVVSTRWSSDARTEPGNQVVFAQTMAYVAATTVIFAVGVYVARPVDGAIGILAFLGSLGCLIGLQIAVVRRCAAAARALLGGFGALLGVAVGPGLVDYVGFDPRPVWQAAIATALLIGVVGAIGWASQRDLGFLARVLSWGLAALLVLGVVQVFVAIPHGAVLYALAGLVIFVGYILVDVQRLRRSTDVTEAPLLAASIFLDVLNVFLLFRTLFGRAP